MKGQSSITQQSGNNPRRGQLIDFYWQAMGMPIGGNTYLRGKHLFEGPRRLFQFLVFQPQDSILSLFHTDKKN